MEFKYLLISTVNIGECFRVNEINTILTNLIYHGELILIDLENLTEFEPSTEKWNLIDRQNSEKEKS